MTSFEMLLQCEMCSDYKQYMVKVNDVGNIVCRMGDVVHRLSEKARDENKNVPHSCNIKPLYMDETHPHFMCGQCHKAGNELMLAEAELRRLLIKAACLLQAVKFPEALGEILHLLQGRYPVTYHAFEEGGRGL